MTSVILFPSAQTDWQAAGRYASSTPVEINEHAAGQIEHWAELIVEHEPTVIYSHSRNPCGQTAQALASRLECKAKTSSDLEDVDVGLWEGLTPEQLRKRFGKAYKLWKDDPAAVCPPEGETMTHAAERLITCIRRLARKHDQECFGVVLGPLAFVAVRCMLETRPYQAYWELAADRPVTYFINPAENKAILTT